MKIMELSKTSRQYFFQLELQARMILNRKKYTEEKYGSFEKVCKKTQEAKQAYNNWLQKAKKLGFDTTKEEAFISQKEEELKRAYSSLTAKTIRTTKTTIEELTLACQQLSDMAQKSAPYCDETEYKDAFNPVDEGEDTVKNDNDNELPF
jgi:flagellar biosynthesis/type III secretory pathway protein FliH